MKKFLIRLLVYTSLVIIVIVILNFAYSLRNSDGTAKMQHVPDGIQICNFGSSHGLNDFNYEDIEKNYVYFNFALGGQSLLYDNRILMNFKDKIKEGANVFIVISHFSFFGIVPETEAADFLSKNRRYYTFLSPELIKCYDRKTDFYVNYMPALVSDNLMSFLGVLLLPPENLWDTSTDRKEALKHGYSRHKYFFRGMKDIQGRLIFRPERLKALYSMIEICKQIKATPILITTPYLKEYNDAVKQNEPEFYGKFYSIIEEVVKNTGVKYYDYSSDERYCNDYSLFINTDHLNRKGARIFTDNLLQEVLGIDVNVP